MEVRMDLAEMDLDDAERIAGEDRANTKESIAGLTAKVTALTRSNWALVVTLLTAMAAIIATLITTR